MDQILQEFVSSRGVDVRVDGRRGVIRGVKLLGLESRNRRRYLPEALVQAAALYEGAKVNVNHPKGSPLAARDYQDRLGSIRQVRAADDGLFGDLHFNPKHALAEQLIWDAEHAPENVGFSHNIEARTSRSGSKTLVEAILKVQSVDLVADPATTHGLFESAGAPGDEPAVTSVSELTLEQLRKQRPDLVEALLGEQAAELTALREEVDRRRAEQVVRDRRAVARRLFREFHLPDPDSDDAATQAVASRWFLETVLSAPNEAAMRQLVEERAELVAAAQQLGSTQPARPVSREQRTAEPARPPLDAGSFARAIS
ncbi:MAG: hypothetical protein DWQ37_01880 [Planctomycetota bacterium]|nr:MAG: hypothetical protein DWQ37_01880 [Planctomycetota bacterium]